VVITGPHRGGEDECNLGKEVLEHSVCNKVNRQRINTKLDTVIHTTNRVIPLITNAL
jgi:hypothetical protein